MLSFFISIRSACRDPRWDLSFVLGKMMYLILIRYVGDAMARKRLEVCPPLPASYFPAICTQK